jgi:hypothetical protein
VWGEAKAQARPLGCRIEHRGCVRVERLARVVEEQGPERLSHFGGAGHVVTGRPNLAVHQAVLREPGRERLGRSDLVGAVLHFVGVDELAHVIEGPGGRL